MATSLIKQLINRVRGSHKTRQPLQKITGDEARLPHRHISHNALKVLQRLQDRGFEAYLVGGGVRDLLLGMKPKDFDVSTNATPEQVKSVFGSNARIIGRRFRLVHVRFGREVIEVATFRTDQTEDTQVARSDEGMLLRDNHWGTVEDDAWRRDFTVNALYYNASEQSLLTLPGSLDDMDQGLLRIIGDPATRLREDPVRMLRAARFAAKLNFDIEPVTEASIAPLAHLLQKVSAARLFDEVIKLLMSGQGQDTFAQCNRLGLMAPMFPDSWQAIDQDPSGFYLRLIEQALINTDARVNAGKPVTPAFLYAVLLWPAVDQEWQRLTELGTPKIPGLHQACTQSLVRHNEYVAIPKRFSAPMREIWDLQPRLLQTQGKKAFNLIAHPRFRAAYDFILLREQAGENLAGAGKWWTKAQQQVQAGEIDLDDLPPPPMLPLEPERKPRRRKPRKRRND